MPYFKNKPKKVNTNDSIINQGTTVTSKDFSTEDYFPVSNNYLNSSELHTKEKIQGLRKNRTLKKFKTDPETLKKLQMNWGL